MKFLNLLIFSFTYFLLFLFQFFFLSFRLFYAGAEQGQMPRVLSMIQVKHLTPAPAVICMVCTNHFLTLMRKKKSCSENRLWNTFQHSHNNVTKLYRLIRWNRMSRWFFILLGVYRFYRTYTGLQKSSQVFSVFIVISEKKFLNTLSVYQIVTKKNYFVTITYITF